MDPSWPEFSEGELRAYRAQADLVLTRMRRTLSQLANAGARTTWRAGQEIKVAVWPVFGPLMDIEVLDRIPDPAWREQQLAGIRRAVAERSAAFAECPLLDTLGDAATAQRDIKLASMAPIASDDDSGQSRKRQRPCHERDHTFLRWKEEEKMGDAAIRDKWNAEHQDDKIGKGEAGRDVVKKGIRAAKRERAGG
jgi:hypothetical protein